MLGGHFQLGPSSPATEQVVRRAGLVKALGDVGVLKIAKRTAIKVYRPRIRQEDQRFAADEYQQGRNCADQAIAELGGWNDERLFIETWNEPSGQKGSERVRLARLIRGFTDRCHERGYKVCGFCFSTGNPEREDIEYFTSLGWCGVDLVALHGYWGNQGLTDWNALRYRQFWAWSGGAMPPMVGTESGRDAIEGGQRGWKRCNINAEIYRSELVAYRAALQADQARGIPMLGSTPFTWAPTSDSNQERNWTDFDMEPFNDICGDWEPAWSLVQKTPVILPVVSPGGDMAVQPYTSPNHGGGRTRTLGVVLHSTRGGTASAALDYQATISHFLNPVSQVSAHAVVGPSGEIWYPIRDGVVGWHAGEHNLEWLGIEIAQTRLGSWLSPQAVAVAARIVAGWCVKYNIPAVWSTVRGLAEHREMPQGKRVGKSDIGAPFDRAAFLEAVRREVAALAPAPPTFNFVELVAYAQWAAARCANLEDPRIKAAFVTHLAALGADSSNPSRYGWPG